MSPRDKGSAGYGHHHKHRDRADHRDEPHETTEVTCPHCGTKRQVDVRLRGITITCHTCFERMHVPGSFATVFYKSMKRHFKPDDEMHRLIDEKITRAENSGESPKPRIGVDDHKRPKG